MIVISSVITVYIKVRAKPLGLIIDEVEVSVLYIVYPNAYIITSFLYDISVITIPHYAGYQPGLI